MWIDSKTSEEAFYGETRDEPGWRDARRGGGESRHSGVSEEM